MKERFTILLLSLPEGERYELPDSIKYAVKKDLGDYHRKRNQWLPEMQEGACLYPTEPGGLPDRGPAGTVCRNSAMWSGCIYRNKGKTRLMRSVPFIWIWKAWTGKIRSTKSFVLQYVIF